MTAPPPEAPGAGTCGPGDGAAPGPVAELQGVGVRFGDRWVLDDVSLSIEAGSFIGLIGSNGAGKTTLLRVIAGMLAPTRGTALLAGRPAARRRDGAAGADAAEGSPPDRPALGYVPQKVLVDPDAPVRARDLVALGLDGARLGFRWPSRQRRQRVDAMLAAVGADGFADARVGTLSGGEQQRVLIAHALIARPRLLLLDEPLANLDIASEQDIVGLLARLAGEQQVAVLLSAHDMNPLLPVMDRIAYVAGGRVACGPTADVVRPEVLSALYGRPVSVLRVDGRVLVVAGGSIESGPGLDAHHHHDDDHGGGR